MGRRARLLLAGAIGAAALLGWRLLHQEADQDPQACSASTVEFMASFAPGIPYPEVVRRLQHLKLRFEAPGPLPDTVADNPPLLYVRVKETGFVVSRREDVRIEFDSEKKLARLDCMVFFHGP
jgi:hypothetical protein